MQGVWFLLLLADFLLHWQHLWISFTYFWWVYPLYFFLLNSSHKCSLTDWAQSACKEKKMWYSERGKDLEVSCTDFKLQYVTLCFLHLRCLIPTHVRVILPQTKSSQHLMNLCTAWEITYGCFWGNSQRPDFLFSTFNFIEPGIWSPQGGNIWDCSILLCSLLWHTKCVYCQAQV